jgi:hypothetical protein
MPTAVGFEVPLHRLDDAEAAERIFALSTPSAKDDSTESPDDTGAVPPICLTPTWNKGRECVGLEHQSLTQRGADSLVLAFDDECASFRLFYRLTWAESWHLGTVGSLSGRVIASSTP